MEVGTTPSLLAGRYKVLDRLGSGGMATVYLAEDERLGRKVAVKRLHSDSPEDAAPRFDREAKVGASLSHPNLVTVFDTVADEEGVLIVMEYVEGENLAELMARERVPAEQAVSIIKAVAGALDHAHQAGVIHRDVKPANILVSPDGKAKLVDLGIATATERTQITAVGTVLGTPSYMAPEQLEGGKIGKSVDIYALGAVAFELLAGRKARRGRTPVEIAHQIANDPVPDIREEWPGAPPAAADVLQHTMSRDPGERPSTAGQLAHCLEDAFKTPAPKPEPTRSTEALAPPVPLQRDERREPAPKPQVAQAPRRAATTPPRSAPPARRTGGLPRWIPVAALVAVLLVAAAAIAGLSSGGKDKGTAPVVATQKPKAAKKTTKKAAPAPKQTTSQTTPATTPQTTPAPTGGQNAAEGARLHNQAFTLASQGQYDQAVALEQKAVPMLEGTSGLTYWYALYNLGHSLRLAGHPDQAIPILQKRLQNPDQQATVQAELQKAQKEAKKG
ncbi:MAG: eukaryotic-like serine/threonine-protein kinase [Thermoleophilaceae bacterium]|nr:eukaryotic-like serine/threonine-protein kinase [Thermoleophilaceae bacterium]